MSLNPSDIESHRFREAFRGYDKDDVDEFLDRVADRINDLIAERSRLEQRVAQVEEDAAESFEAERLLKRTLITAQRTADETVAEAREEAERMRADAERHALQVRDEAEAHAVGVRQQADEYAADVRQDADQRAAEAVADARERAAAAVDDAQQRAATVLSEAQERAAAIVGDAERAADHDRRTAREELERVQRAVADLERYRLEYRERVRGVVAEQLAALDRIGELPQVPEKLARLPQRTAESLGGDGEEGLGSMRAQPTPQVEAPAAETRRSDAPELFLDVAEDPDDLEASQTASPIRGNRRSALRRGRDEERA